MRTLSCFLLLVALGCTRVKPTDPPSAQPDKPAAEITKNVVAAENQFACELYVRLSQKSGNLVLSPVSISTALAMTYPGAVGNTALEMVQTMHWKDANEHHAVNAYRLHEWAKDDSAVRVANALWGQQGHSWQPDFRAITKDKYRAGLQEVDFATGDAARNTINQWVAARTNDRIKTLLPEGSVTPLTKLVLTNAVAFQGSWQHAFKKVGTQESRFYPENGKFVEVPTMYQTHKFHYARLDHLDLLELPYKGNEQRMLIVLPHLIAELPKIEKSLSAEQIAQWLAALQKTEVNVGLPKFRTASDFTLKEPLQALGMKDAFDRGAANFKGMDGTDQLFIDNVYHKGFIEVTEEGTEAAGAAGVVMEMKGEDAPRIPPQFHVNKPFLFFIRDTATGSILFMGRISNPKE